MTPAALALAAFALAGACQDGCAQSLPAPVHLDGWVNSVAYSPAGAALAASTVTGAIFLLEAGTGGIEQTLQHGEVVWSVAFSPDGLRLASGGGNHGGIVCVWSLRRSRCARTFMEGRATFGVAFSPDGARLASANFDQKVRIYDLRSGEGEPRVLAGHTGSVMSVAFSPDGARLSSAGGFDGTIRIWDVASGTTMREIQQVEYVSSVAYSPTEARVASSGYATIRIWDPESGGLLQTLKGHTGWVTSVAYSPDGKHLASSSADGTIRFWNVTTEDSVVLQAGSIVRSVAYSPDQQALASGSDDCLIHFWPSSEGDTIVV